MQQYIVVLLLGALLGGSGAWYWQDLRWTRAEALSRASAATELQRATSVAKTTTDAVQARADASARLYDKLKEKSEREAADLARRIAFAGVRLTAPGACPTSPAPAAEPGADAPRACELQAGTSADLAALAARADSVALKFNALQDHVRGLTCGGPDGTLAE